LKYLVIAGVVALLLVFVYSRVRPYLKLAGKILGTAKSMAESQSTGGVRTSRSKSDKKLVRCVACGTWVPTDRAFGSKPSVAPYCSRECLEKASTAGRRTAAS
jgi:hypothetical protein